MQELEDSVIAYIYKLAEIFRRHITKHFMPYIADTEIDLTPHTKGSYIISSQHRRTGNPNKSIWTITFDEEVGCFIHALKSNWKIGPEIWGVKVDGNSLQIVGRTHSNIELKIAKFVDGNNTNVWHGYPADYMAKAQDRPATNILKVWVDKGFLTKAKMSKIRLGQSCNL